MACIKNYEQTDTELVKQNEFSSNCQMAEAVIHVKTVMTGLTRAMRSQSADGGCST